MPWYNPISWFGETGQKAKDLSMQVKPALGPGGMGKWLLWEARKAEEARRMLQEERDARIEAGVRPPTFEEYKKLWHEGKIDRKHDIMDTVDTWNTVNPAVTPDAMGDDEKIVLWYQASYSFEIEYWKVYDEEQAEFHQAEAARVKEQFGITDYDEWLKRADEGHNIINDKRKWSRGWR